MLFSLFNNYLKDSKSFIIVKYYCCCFFASAITLPKNTYPVANTTCIKVIFPDNDISCNTCNTAIKYPRVDVFQCSPIKNFFISIDLILINIFIGMNSLRQIIKEHLLLEKRIAQLTDSFKISIAYDIITTKHARDRSNIGREGLGERIISNKDIINVMEKATRKISERIVNGRIIDNEPFIVKDKELHLDLAVSPKLVENFFWELMVITVFTSSENLSLSKGRGQVVINV